MIKEIIQEIIKKLKNNQPETRMIAAELLGYFNQNATENINILKEALSEEKNPDVRTEIVISIDSLIGTDYITKENITEYINIFIDILKNPNENEEIKNISANSLENLIHKADDEKVQEIIKLLIISVKHTSNFYESAIQFLGSDNLIQKGSSENISEIIKILTEKMPASSNHDNIRKIRKNMIESLGNLANKCNDSSQKNEIVDILFKSLLCDTDKETREATAIALGNLININVKIKEEIKYLLRYKLLTDLDENVRSTILIALENLKETPTVIPVLLTLLKHGTSNEKEISAALLGNLTKPIDEKLQSIIPVLMGATSDQEAMVRVHSTKTLGNQTKDNPAPEVIQKLMELLGDPTIEVKKAAILALSNLKVNLEQTKKIVSALMDTFQNDPNTQIKCLALMQLGTKINENIYTDEITNLLLQAVDEKNADIKKTALLSLGNVKESNKVLDILLKFLESEESILRYAAVESLWKLTLSPEQIQTVINPLIKMLKKDPQEHIREIAACLLGDLNYSSEYVIKALSQSLEDPNGDVREKSAKSLIKLSEQLSLNPPLGFSNTFQNIETLSLPTSLEKDENANNGNNPTLKRKRSPSLDEAEN